MHSIFMAFFVQKPHVWTNKKRKKRNEQQKNKNKKRRMTKEKNNLDDDLVVTQILSRLPAKSLMRFKSVRKGWKSIIEKDSHFINLHRAHSQSRPPQLLTIILDQQFRNIRRGHFDLLSADLDFDGGDDVDSHVRGASIHCSATCVRAPSKFVDVVGLVRGLLCFVDLINFDVMVYNVTTRQAVTSWIRTSVSLKKPPFEEPVCQFGFDPDSGEYKVIFIWQVSSTSVRTRVSPCCEVLTVGVDASWRIIEDVPTLEVEGHKSTYANGSIYWMSELVDPLVEFNVGSEKFRTIRVPKFIDWGLPTGYLMELDGCLTMVPLSSLGARKQKLWKFNDHNKKRSNGTSNTTRVSRSERKKWTAVSFRIPRYICPWATVIHQIPGKDQIILESYSLNQELERHVRYARFYSYNRINKTFSKFKIQGIPSFSKCDRSRCKVFVEDLCPVAVEKSKTSEEPI